jgi:hypothetical protein
MLMLAVLIRLRGTDFSRGLPLVGPMTVWQMMQVCDLSLFFHFSYVAAPHHANIEAGAERILRSAAVV